MIRAILFFGLCCVFAIAALANDSAVTGEGGRVSRIKGEDAGVRMVKETVRVDLYPDYYDVTADFLFKNDGQAVTVTMGFPEGGAGDVDVTPYVDRTAFQNFHTWVDDQEVNATRQATIEEDSYQAYWVKAVSFTAGQQRRVRVAYRSKPGDSVATKRFAVYNFTGGNWKDKVDESTLILTPHLPDTWVLGFEGMPDEDQLKFKQWNGDQLTLRWKDWQAEGNFAIYYNSTFSGWMIVDEMINPFDPPIERKTITQPGKAKTLDWLPPAVTRDGEDFISLQALENYLTNRERDKKSDKTAAVTWSMKTLEATFRWEGKTYGFKLKRNTMTVTGQAPVTLPAAPFLSRNQTGFDSGDVYVPLQPLIKSLGGKATVNRAEHRARITIP